MINKKIFLISTIIMLIFVFMQISFASIILWGPNTKNNNEVTISQEWYDFRDNNHLDKDYLIKGDSKNLAILKYKFKNESTIKNWADYQANHQQELQNIIGNLNLENNYNNFYVLTPTGLINYNESLNQK